MTSVTRALVLAAGKGTRIHQVAPGRPKPLIEVGGMTVLERNLRRLAAAGVRDVWINLHTLGEQIEAVVGDGQRYGLRVGYSWEPELLGTAGAAKNLQAALGGETFLVVYGDNLTSLDLLQMIAAHRQSGALVTVAIYDRDRVPNTGLAGGRVVLDRSGRIVGFEEGGHSASPYVNAGVYLVEPRLLDLIPAGVPWDFGHDVFPALIEHGELVQSYAGIEYCLAIDTPEALTRGESLLEALETNKEVVRQ